jgi:hypothetical protein
MLCEETKRLFSVYIDDALALPVRMAVGEHLRQCPVCRAGVAELRSIKNSLRALSRPVAPVDLESSIIEAVEIEAAVCRLQPRLSPGDRFAQWIEPKLMPYTVGSFASVILFIAIFAGLRPTFVALHEAGERETASYRVVPQTGYNIYQPVTSEDYAAQRAPFTGQSPSLNPKGALAVLTRSNARLNYAEPNEDADDMIVVADVFSNGSASLAGVVQAPRNRRMLDDFESALRQNAAFVPASLDRRPDTMRVVFTMQKVDVRDRNF